MAKIYTKTGDDGTTGLASGERISKSSLRVNLYGTSDELNSVLGLAIAAYPTKDLQEDLIILQNLMFNLGSDLSTPLDPPPQFKIPRITLDEVNWLEARIDYYTSKLNPLRNFILPGGTKSASFLHLARSVCRRAERLCVELSKTEDLGLFALVFLNRLSDYLFTVARYENSISSDGDIIWDKNPLSGI